MESRHPEILTWIKGPETVINQFGIEVSAPKMSVSCNRLNSESLSFHDQQRDVQSPSSKIKDKHGLHGGPLCFIAVGNGPDCWFIHQSKDPQAGNRGYLFVSSLCASLK